MPSATSNGVRSLPRNHDVLRLSPLSLRCLPVLLLSTIAVNLQPSGVQSMRLDPMLGHMPVKSSSSCMLKGPMGSNLAGEPSLNCSRILIKRYS